MKYFCLIFVVDYKKIIFSWINYYNYPRKYRVAQPQFFCARRRRILSAANPFTTRRIRSCVVLFSERSLGRFFFSVLRVPRIIWPSVYPSCRLQYLSAYPRLFVLGGLELTAANLEGFSGVTASLSLPLRRWFNPSEWSPSKRPRLSSS